MEPAAGALPDGDGDHGRAVDIDHHAVEGLGETRGHVAETGSGNDAQHPPKGELAFKQAHRFGVGATHASIERGVVAHTNSFLNPGN